MAEETAWRKMERRDCRQKEKRRAWRKKSGRENSKKNVEGESLIKTVEMRAWRGNEKDSWMKKTEELKKNQTRELKDKKHTGILKEKLQRIPWRKKVEGREKKKQKAEFEGKMERRAWTIN